MAQASWYFHFLFFQCHLFLLVSLLVLILLAETGYKSWQHICWVVIQNRHCARIRGEIDSLSRLVSWSKLVQSYCIPLLANWGRCYKRHTFWEHNDKFNLNNGFCGSMVLFYNNYIRNECSKWTFLARHDNWLRSWWNLRIDRTEDRNLRWKSLLGKQRSVHHYWHGCHAC